MDKSEKNNILSRFLFSALVVGLREAKGSEDLAVVFLEALENCMEEIC